MHARRKSGSSPSRLPVLLVVIGVWGIVFGLFFAYLALDLLAFAETTSGESDWMVADILWPMQMLFEGGVLALGGGSLMMVLGCVLVMFSS